MSKSESNDDEVYSLVADLRTRSPQACAVVLHDVDDQVAVMNAMLPFRGGPRGLRKELEWDKAIAQSGPRRFAESESFDEIERRVLGDFDVMREVLSVTDTVRCLSDGFYGVGIECDLKSTIFVISRWLTLPHAFFLFVPGKAVQLIMFGRSSYVFYY